MRTFAAEAIEGATVHPVLTRRGGWHVGHLIARLIRHALSGNHTFVTWRVTPRSCLHRHGCVAGGLTGISAHGEPSAVRWSQKPKERLVP